MKNENEDISIEMLHIDIGNQPILKWLANNKYIIFSELVRYSEYLITKKLDYVNALLITNFTENIVLVLQKENVSMTLDYAMNYFLFIEEYELCSKIRDLQILIQKSKKDEERNFKSSVQNKRKSKIH
jgi:hypothetical protein